MGHTQAAQGSLGRPVTFEDIACPLCDARSEEELLRVRTAGHCNAYRLVRCRQCGLGYLNPRPDERSIAQFYPDEYEWYQPPVRRRSAWTQTRQHLRRLVMARSFGTPPKLNGWRDQLLAAVAGPWIRPAADSMTALPYQGAGKLLDFGCGSGWYAHKMREFGWDVTGMDFNPQVAANVRARFGIPTLTGSLPHPAVPPESYDVITMGAVLEHVHRPHEVVAAAASALRPGGYLMVSVPNLASWGFQVFGAHWWGLQIPHHLLHFTPATLRQLLAMHGLEVRTLLVHGQAGWMRRSLATVRREEPHRPGPLNQLGKLRVVSSLLTRWSVWRGQGDCLQALAYRPEQSERRIRQAA